MAPENKSALIHNINKYITECYIIIFYYYYCALTHALQKHTVARVHVRVYVNSINYYVIDSDQFAHFVIIRVYRHNAYYLRNI